MGLQARHSSNSNIPQGETMSAQNGHVNGSENGHLNTVDHDPQPPLSIPEKTLNLIVQLAVPFDPAVIEWRVTNTSKDKKRGQVIPYASQRAYTDRLNGLLSPAGWTRQYMVHTSSNFQRKHDQTNTAKVFVTCDLTIFGIGSHAATGEEWTDNENAGTSAEAQAFKRACSCFGLGRYLYYFEGTWVDLDHQKRPTTTPRLGGWATPEGWRSGLRPGTEGHGNSCLISAHEGSLRVQGENSQKSNSELLRQIEAMAKPLGKGIYRGLMKTVARAWNPGDVRDVSILQKLLSQMQAAERGLLRLEAARSLTGIKPLSEILTSLKLRSIDQVDNLEVLHKIVLALETKAVSSNSHI
jgi:hypothetical protein